ncbi:hypothetical protein ABZ370_28045 [Streptomyces sp. NPDC005962]|uniref:hypothetical protein n=1 Tax=Streptomyces sp. NPDC005962 TaxID=3154466 RepID=UPI0033EB2A42
MCAGLAATLTACGGEGETADPDAGTNGVGKLPATKIESKARTAAGGADAVHLSGSLMSKGRTYKVDMKLKGDGGTGVVSTKGSRYELLRVGEELYLKADAGFWAHQGAGGGSGGSGGHSGDAAAAGKLEDKYVKVPSGDPAYKRLSGFTDKSVMLDGLLGLHGTITAGDRGEVGGIRTIRILGGQGGGGTLDVSLEGRPYPLRLERAGDAGVIRLADWNKDFKLAAPDDDHVVDYGQQIPTGT